MNPRAYILTFWICFVGLGALQSQDPSTWHITEEQGLPSQVIYYALQDSLGYLWFATENGITRFDGKTFQLIEDPDLPLGEVLFLREDPLGKIWFLSLNGLLGYISNDSLHRFIPDEFTEEFETQNFYWTSNSLWIQAKTNDRYHYLKYDLEGDSVSQKASFAISEKDYTRKIHLSEGGRLGATSKGDIQIFSPEKNNFETIIFNPINHPMRMVYELEDGSYFLFSKTELFYYKAGEIQKLDFPGQNPSGNYLYTSGNLTFILGKQGIYLYNKINDKWIFKTRILSEIAPNFIFQDREKNFWIGGDGTGLWMIPSLNIHLYRPSSLKNNTSSLDCFQKLSDSTLLAGYQNGELGKFEIIADSLLYRSMPISFPKGEFRKIVQFNSEDRNGYLIVENGSLSYYSLDFEENWKIRNNIKDFALFHDTLWFANHVGIGKIAEGANFKILGPTPERLNEMVSHKVGRTYSLQTDKDRLWIGTTKGLNYYKDGKIFNWKGNDPKSRIRISQILLGQQGQLFVATRGSGVLLIQEEEIVKRYGTSNGLSSNQCPQITLHKNHLWVATDKGLNRIDLSNDSISVYNKYDGLPSNEILAVATLSNHRIIIGTTKGVAVLPDTLRAINPNVPKVHINEIKVNGVAQSLSYLKSLNHRENNLEVKFIAPHFKSRGQVTFYYRIIGLQENWLPRSINNIRMSSFPSGEYELQIYCENEDGIRSEQITKVPFNIIAPVWQRRWFQALVVLFLMGLTWLIVTIRFRQIRKKETLEQSLRERINELQTRALQAQMNPHFVFNALNSVQHFISADKQEQAMVALSKFAQLIRMIFEQSKEKEISLDRELEFLKLYLDFEKMRYGKKVAIELDVAHALKPHVNSIYIPPLLIQPIIENAFKHGLMDKEEGGKVSIKFEPLSNIVQCTIEDNGMGRKYIALKKTKPPKWRQTPSGLNTTRERLALLHKDKIAMPSDLEIIDLENDQGESIGTKVIMRIPMKKV